MNCCERGRGHRLELLRPVCGSAGISNRYANPRISLDVARVAGIRLDFLAQLIDEHAQVFRLFAVIRPPYGLQQSPVRHGFSFVADQQPKQIEFLGSQADRFTFHSHFAPVEIDA